MKSDRTINSLPEELLCEIFLRTISPLSAHTDRCRLMLVCLLWKEHVESSALLWADISARHSPSYVRRALKRSKASMINLDYPTLTRADNLDLEWFMTEAAPHIARWRSLTVAIRPSPVSLESRLGRLITAQAPSLENLQLHMIGRSYWLNRTPIILFNGSPASSTLKYLNLHSVQVVIGPLCLSGLIQLEISNVSNISTPQLLEILRNSPSLETLTLDENEGLLAVGSQFPAVPPITLPKLSSLTLQWIDHGAENYILSSIRIPNRRSIYICDDIFGEGASSILLTPTIAHILRATIPTPDPKFSDIKINVDSIEGCYECVVQVRGIMLHLLVDGGNQIEGIFGWLAEGLGSEAVACPVLLSLKCVEMDPVHLASVPSPLVIKHLSIPGSSLTSLLRSSFVAIFQPPRAIPSGGLLEQVESLTVEFDTIESQNEFINMLRRRYAEVAPSDETEARRPTSLKSVELRGSPKTEGLVEEIVGIVSEVNVFWGDQ